VEKRHAFAACPFAMSDDDSEVVITKVCKWWNDGRISTGEVPKRFQKKQIKYPDTQMYGIFTYIYPEIDHTLSAWDVVGWLLPIL